MKKLSSALMVSVVMLTATSMVFAQGNKPRSGENKKEHFEKIEAAKKEYFTQELKLTDKESEKFWTVYDEFSKAKKENWKKQREIGKELREKYDSIPEKDVKSKTESILKLEAENIDIRKNYLTKASEVIGYKRAAKSLYLEQEFRRELMSKVSGKRSEGRGPNPGVERLQRKAREVAPAE